MFERVRKIIGIIADTFIVLMGAYISYNDFARGHIKSGIFFTCLTIVYIIDEVIKIVRREKNRKMKDDFLEGKDDEQTK